MKLYRNILHLFIWQGSTYLVPLVVTPYLARVLGLEAFGIYGFSLAVVVYGALLTDWGFSLSATQSVARATGQPEKLRELFWSTMMARAVLAVVAYVLLAIAVLSVPAFRAMWPVLAAASLSIISTALSANFFLQGLQFMGAFAVSSLIGKLSIVPLMLFFVHRPGDVVWAAGIQNGTQIISAVVSILVSNRLVPLGRMRFDPRGISAQIRDGAIYFSSNLAISLYTQAAAIVVGLTAGPAQAGLLTGSQRISQAFQQVISPINMAVFPQVNKLTHEDPPAAVRFMKRLLVGQIAFAALMSVAMFFLSPFLVHWFLGRQFAPATAVVAILSFMPVLVGATNVFGGSMLVPLGLKKSYTASLMLSGVFNLAMLFVFATRLGAVGGAIAGVVTEVFLVIAMGFGLYLNRSVFTRMRAGERP